MSRAEGAHAPIRIPTPTREAMNQPDQSAKHTASEWTRTRDIGSYTAYQTPQVIDDDPRVSHVWKGLLEWRDMKPVHWHAPLVSCVYHCTNTTYGYRAAQCASPTRPPSSPRQTGSKHDQQALPDSEPEHLLITRQATRHDAARATILRCRAVTVVELEGRPIQTATRTIKPFFRIQQIKALG